MRQYIAPLPQNVQDEILELDLQIEELYTVIDDIRMISPENSEALQAIGTRIRELVAPIHNPSHIDVPNR